MVAKIIIFTGNAVNDDKWWFCRNCGTKFELDDEIASKKSKPNNTNHYCIICAEKLNLIWIIVLCLINENKLKVGDRLPSERDLSETFGISRGVLRESIRALEIAGIIDARSGSGNFIKSNANITREIEALNILEVVDLDLKTLCLDFFIYGQKHYLPYL